MLARTCKMKMDSTEFGTTPLRSQVWIQASTAELEAFGWLQTTGQPPRSLASRGTRACKLTWLQTAYCARCSLSQSLKCPRGASRLYITDPEQAPRAVLAAPSALENRLTVLAMRRSTGAWSILKIRSASTTSLSVPHGGAWSFHKIPGNSYTEPMTPRCLKSSRWRLERSSCI